MDHGHLARLHGIIGMGILACSLVAAIVPPVWAQAPSLTWSTANLSEGRYDMAATAVGNFALFGGGERSGGHSGVVDIFDSTTKTFTGTYALSEVRNDPGATSAGTFALFAGGNLGGGTRSNRVDFYDSTQGAPDNPAAWGTHTLSQARTGPAATAVCGRALFAGGIAGAGSSSSVVDVYDSAVGRPDNAAAWTTASPLSQARISVAATSVGPYALFAGGWVFETGAGSAVVDIYDCSSGALIHNTGHALSQARIPKATTIGPYALFAGGLDSSGTPSAVVDIYDYTQGPPTNPAAWSTHTLSQARYNLASTSVGAFALFAGGDIGAGASSNVVDLYDSSLGPPTNPAAWSTATLSQARDSLAATSVAGIALFGGGLLSDNSRSTAVDLAQAPPQILSVAIDIKPGSFPNSINLASAGVVPVAILSSATFDATQVDPATVTLAGATVSLIGKASKYSCSSQDVNSDGLTDLVCHVETAQFNIQTGDSVAVLEAKTFSGQSIRGEDIIRIVP